VFKNKLFIKEIWLKSDAVSEEEKKSCFSSDEIGILG
jgi:hypothetical protein